MGNHSLNNSNIILRDFWVDFSINVNLTLSPLLSEGLKMRVKYQAQDFKTRLKVYLKLGCLFIVGALIWFSIYFGLIYYK